MEHHHADDHQDPYARQPRPKGVHATPAQIALAWILAQRPWIVPIPGTSKRHRIEENIAAADIELSADDVRELTEAADRMAVSGDRYNAATQRMIDR